MENNELRQYRKCSSCKRWLLNQATCEDCNHVVAKDKWYSSQGNLTDVYLAENMPKQELTYKEKKK